MSPRQRSWVWSSQYNTEGLGYSTGWGKSRSDTNRKPSCPRDLSTSLRAGWGTTEWRSKHSPTLPGLVLELPISSCASCPQCPAQPRAAIPLSASHEGPGISQCVFKKCSWVSLPILVSSSDGYVPSIRRLMLRSGLDHNLPEMSWNQSMDHSCEPLGTPSLTWIFIQSTLKFQKKINIFCFLPAGGGVGGKGVKAKRPVTSLNLVSLYCPRSPSPIKWVLPSCFNQYLIP